MKVPGKIKNCAFVMAALSLAFTACNKNNPTSSTTNATWQTVFSDDFNRADGSVGVNYSVQWYGGGATSILSNRVRVAGGTNYAIRYLTGVANQVVKVSVKCTTTMAPLGGYGLGVTVKSRSLGDTTWMNQEMYSGYVWLIAIPASNYTPALPDSSAGIFRVSGIGLPTPLASQSCVIKKGGAYLIELIADKNVLTLVVTDLATNSPQTVTVTDAGPALAGTIVSLNGMQTDGDTTYFDDFKIEKYE